MNEAKMLREEQTRPFVVVDFEPGWLVHLVVQNVGATAARDVKIRFDPPLTSTLTEPNEWQESTSFSEGISLLPPHRQIRVLFDGIIQRFNSELPSRYKVELTYRGPTAKSRPYTDSYMLDLNVFRGTTPPPEGLPELVKKLDDLHGVLKSWTYGINGLRVYGIDAKAHAAEVRVAMEERRSARMAQETQAERAKQPPRKRAPARKSKDS